VPPQYPRTRFPRPATIYSLDGNAKGRKITFVNNATLIGKGSIMPYYLFRGAYTSEAWASLVKQPQNRTEVVRAALEKLGGTLEGLWFAFGEEDVVAICKMPDNVSAAAFSLAVAAGGGLKSSTTTPLMTFEEGLEAMKKAAKSGYRPPK
jgi:uncharacterized protein with GYD domain